MNPEETAVPEHVPIRPVRIRPPARDRRRPRRTLPAVVVGAGPVGWPAIDLARPGPAEVLLLDNDDTVSIGSRGVCYAKRTLEVLTARLRRGGRSTKGVNLGRRRTFFRDRRGVNFNLSRARPPPPGHDQPAAVLPGDYLVAARAQAAGRCEMRWKNSVISVTCPARTR